MTVADLLVELQRLDPEMVVMVWDSDGSGDKQAESVRPFGEKAIIIE